MLNLSKKNIFKEYKEINFFNKFLYILLSVSLFLGLYFGEDSSGGGTITDFYSTFPLVENPLNFRDDINWHFPLHYYFAGFFYYLFGSQEYLKFFFVLITLFIPLLFYCCLRIKYENCNKNNLFFISLILFLLPALRTSAIWPNSHLTATLFFLGSLFFFLKWRRDKIFNKINLDLFFSLLLMALAVYTRQLYAIIYIYLVFYFFTKMSLKHFAYLSLIIFLMAIPGIYMVFNWPKTLTLSFDPKIQNSILVNSSIICFYLLPFFIINFFYNKKNKYNYYFLYIVLFSLISVFLLSNYFDYNYRMGGGAFSKLSVILFDNLYLFFFTSFLGLSLVLTLCKRNLNDFILFGLIIFGFSASIIPQKYFEPLIIIIFLLLSNAKFLKPFIKSKIKINLLFIYFTLYLIFAIVNDIYNFNSNI